MSLAEVRRQRLRKLTEKLKAPAHVEQGLLMFASGYESGVTNVVFALLAFWPSKPNARTHHL